MKYTLTSIFAVMALTISAQPWVEMMENPHVNFFEVQEAFEAEWGDNPYERGKGYKQFKRWEHFTEPRVYPSGKRDIAEKFWQGAMEAQAIPGQQAKTDNAWQPLGPTEWESMSYNPGLGRVNGIVVDPNNDEKIYVCTPSGGLWVYDNDAWTPLTDHLPSIGATDLAIDPTNSEVMYLATGDGHGSDAYSIGVLKTTDGGATWQTTALTHEVADGHTMSRIVMNEYDPQNLFVAGTSGLYKTQDGGGTWTQLRTGLHRDVRLKPGNPEVIYAATGNAFRYSTDGGENFDAAAGLPDPSLVGRYAIAVTPANPELVYLLASRSSNSGYLGLYRSQDAGQSFALMSDSPNIMTYSEIGDGEGGQAWYDMALVASPTDENYILTGGINVWSSSDGGANWDIKSHWVYPSSYGYTHADIHTLNYYGDVLYCGSDGGIFRSDNDGAEWEDLSAGLQISQFYRIAVSHSDPDKILVGSQDNGTNLFVADGSYYHLMGGDGNAAAIDYTNDDIMYAAFPGGSFIKSTNGGQSFTNFSNDVDETGAWVTPFDIHPTQPQITFAAYENLWRNQNSTWEKMSELPTTTTLRAMEVAPDNPSVIYVSTFSSLFRSDPESGEWDAIHSGLPNLFISDIESDPQDADRLWVTFSGYEAEHKVYQSENGGQTWTNITENLPNLPVNCISYLDGSDDGLYIGTDNGVFYRSNASPNWTAYNDGLPNVIVNQILFHYGAQEIIVATYGRGVWKNGFLDASTLQPNAVFNTEKQLLCEGDAIAFGNFSVNAATGVEWVFEGGQPATSTEFSPTVTYPTAGKFAVTLIAHNHDLSDTLISTDFIHVLPGTGEATPFMEDFEQSLDVRPWEVENTGDPVGWERTDIGYYSDHSIWVENFLNPHGKTEIFESHTFDLTSMDTALVTMRVAFASKPEATGHDILRFLISTDCGETWVSKKSFISALHLATAPPSASPYVPEPESDWNLLVVNNIQPDERTSDFRMRLELLSAGGNNIFIDDILIAEEIPTAIPTREDPNYQMELSPNPSVGSHTELRFSLPASSALDTRVINANGQVVFADEKQIYAAGEHRRALDVGSLKPGIYFVELNGDAGRSVRKLVVAE